MPRERRQGVADEPGRVLRAHAAIAREIAGVGFSDGQRSHRQVHPRPGFPTRRRGGVDRQSRRAAARRMDARRRRDFVLRRGERLEAVAASVGISDSDREVGNIVTIFETRSRLERLRRSRRPPRRRVLHDVAALRASLQPGRRRPNRLALRL